MTFLSPSPSERLRRLARSGTVRLAALLSLASLVPLWSVEYPPLQDYPYHLVRAQIIAEFDDPEYAYPETFSLSLAPTPYVLVDYLVAGLGRFLGVERAGKVVLSLSLLLLPASLFYLLGAVDPAKTPLGFAGFLLAQSWYFHMGFVSFVLGLPAALFAVGWWWKHRHGLSPGRLAVLALLVFIVLLLHVYAFGVLAFLLLVLAAREQRRVRQWGATALAFVPASLLLLSLALTLAKGADAGSHAWILLYGGPVRKVLLFLRAWPSFSVPWEGALFGLAGLLVACLLWRSRPFGTVERTFLVATLALGLLYLALPEHVGTVLFVSNRVVPFAVLAALVAVSPKALARAGKLVPTALATLALLHLGGLFLQYRATNRQLASYAAALDHLPRDAKPAFRAEHATMKRGRVAPAALFGGYHYLESPGSRIPDLEHFVGFLRPVSYRRQEGETMSTAAVRTREDLESQLGRRWLVGRGGGVLVLGDDGGEIAATARRLGYAAPLRVGPAAAYLKTEPVYLEVPEERYYTTGYGEGFDHVVVLQDPAHGEPAVEPGFRLVFREGPASLYERERPNDPTEPAPNAERDPVHLRSPVGPAHRARSAGGPLEESRLLPPRQLADVPQAEHRAQMNRTGPIHRPNPSRQTHPEQSLSREHRAETRRTGLQRGAP